jgi:hypothetical protein
MNRNLHTQAQTGAASYDAGLRAHFMRVYNTMTLGLVLTGLVAWFTSQSPAMSQWLMETQQSGWGILLALSPMLIIMFAFNPAAARKMSSAALTGVFLAFSAYFGWLLSTLFVVYTGASIARVFFITSATFAAMSLWGYTTKKDLSAMGSFLMMGVFGLIIAIVVNMFLQSTMMHFIISGAGVIIYTLLTAYDTQTIKESYQESAGGEANAKLAVFGALSLYINFIMLFQFLLSLLGQRE